MTGKTRERLRWEREWRTQRLRDRWIMAPRWAQVAIQGAIWLAFFVSYKLLDDVITGRWRAAWYVIAVLITAWIVIDTIRQNRRR